MLLYFLQVGGTLIGEKRRYSTCGKLTEMQEPHVSNNLVILQCNKSNKGALSWAYSKKVLMKQG
jgi:hypothetical protein